MAATAEPVTNKQLMEGLDRIQSNIQEKSRQRVDFNNRAGGVIAYEQHSSHQWPNEKLKSMMDSYAPFVSSTEINMLSNSGRKPMSGIGPYL